MWALLQAAQTSSAQDLAQLGRRGRNPEPGMACSERWRRGRREHGRTRLVFFFIIHRAHFSSRPYTGGHVPRITREHVLCFLFPSSRSAISSCLHTGTRVLPKIPWLGAHELLSRALFLFSAFPPILFSSVRCVACSNALFRVIPYSSRSLLLAWLGWATEAPVWLVVFGSGQDFPVHCDLGWGPGITSHSASMVCVP